MRQYAVYILASRSRTLYVGATSDLPKRIVRHRAGNCAYTARYRIFRLVYWEKADSLPTARTRERQLKAYGRPKKIALIRQTNPTWKDLSACWGTWPLPADPWLRSG